MNKIDKCASNLTYPPCFESEKLRNTSSRDERKVKKEVNLCKITPVVVYIAIGGIKKIKGKIDGTNIFTSVSFHFKYCLIEHYKSTVYGILERNLIHRVPWGGKPKCKRETKMGRSR